MRIHNYIQFYDICKCFDKLYLRDVTKDLGNNGITGKLYRIIYLLNCNTKIRVRTAFGKTNTIEAGETVRQGSVLGRLLVQIQWTRSKKRPIKEGQQQT